LLEVGVTKESNRLPGRRERLTTWRTAGGPHRTLSKPKGSVRGGVARGEDHVRSQGLTKHGRDWVGTGRWKTKGHHGLEQRLDSLGVRNPQVSFQRAGEGGKGGE